MTVPCPCCGKPMDDAPLKAVVHADLTVMQRRIVDALAHSYPRGMSSLDIAERVYGDDPDGGPEYASRCVYVQLFRIRRAIRPLGWTAGAVGSRRSGEIALQRIGGHR